RAAKRRQSKIEAGGGGGKPKPPPLLLPPPPPPPPSPPPGSFPPPAPRLCFLRSSTFSPLPISSPDTLSPGLRSCCRRVVRCACFCAAHAELSARTRLSTRITKTPVVDFTGWLTVPTGNPNAAPMGVLN